MVVSRRIHFGDAQGGGLGQAVQQELGDVEEGFWEIEAEWLLLQQKNRYDIPTGRSGSSPLEGVGATLSTYRCRQLAPLAFNTGLWAMYF